MQIKFLQIIGRRDGYTPSQCNRTMMISELIDALEEQKSIHGDIPVFLNNDNGYTYGSIGDDIEMVEDFDDDYAKEDWWNKIYSPYNEEDNDY